MPGIGLPFGRERGGGAAVWPAWVGPVPKARRCAEPADPWLDPAEAHEGETALEDLAAAEDPADAARILARYLAVRLLRSEVVPVPGFRADLERTAARSFLGCLPPEDPDRRALMALVEEPLPEGQAGLLARRVESAAAAAARRGHGRGSFAVLHAGYRLAATRGRHLDAARIARRLVVLAAARGAVPAARRWGLRARSHERRAAPD